MKVPISYIEAMTSSLISHQPKSRFPYRSLVSNSNK